MKQSEFFVNAIKSGSIENVRKHYKPEFMELKDVEYWKPIHHACSGSNVEIVEYLILQKCDIEACGSGNWRPIHCACWNGRFEIVKYLIQQKCDIEACGNENWRPIHKACHNGHIEVVRLLLDNQCDIETRELSSNLSSTDVAKKRGHNQIVVMINEEILRRKLIRELAERMNLKCDPGCDHKLCFKSLLSGKFDKSDEIGRGGFGKVYRIKASQTNSEFAVKFIDKSKVDVKYIEENINKYIGQLSHDKIVKYYGSMEKQNKWCIFMEFMEGKSLEKYIRNHHPMSNMEIIQYSKQIFEGLAFLHQNKIIHRDIKPANILLDQNNNTKLADFGLGRSLSKTDALSTVATTKCGTPHYTSPEIMNGKPYKYSADIWSVGATVIEMISGERPYSKLEPSAVIIRISTTKKIEFQFPRKMLKDIKSLIKKMLNPNHHKRPSAEKLLELKLFQ